MDEVIAPGMPEAFWKFLGTTCRVPAQAFQPLAGEDMPEPDRGLLVHERDMTSTLAVFHRATLRVDILQLQQSDGLYLREVFLRTADTNRIVEYGVIAVDLARFSPEQRAEITAGLIPLGGLLHAFKVPFVSKPIGFIAVSTGALPIAQRAVLSRPTCFGRFNRLATPGGEPLAWILEILPP
jgi:hypothetical protein